MHIEDLYNLGEVELSRMLLEPTVLRNPGLLQDIIHLNPMLELRNEHGWTPLHTAVRFGIASAIPVLLQAGSNVNSRCKEGWTILHSAIHIPITYTKMLVEHGADIYATNSYGVTTLHSAASAVDYELCRFLLESGADVHAQVMLGYRNRDVTFLPPWVLDGSPLWVAYTKVTDEKMNVDQSQRVWDIISLLEEYQGIRAKAIA